MKEKTKLIKWYTIGVPLLAVALIISSLFDRTPQQQFFQGLILGLAIDLVLVAVWSFVEQTRESRRTEQ